VQGPGQALLADFETEIWSLEDLRPHPENCRKHPKTGSPKWEALRASLQYDYFDPMVVNRRNGLLVSGHLRRAILMEMGERQARVIVKDYDENTHRARLVAANTLIGEWEETMLAKLAGELEAAGVDAALMGLTHKEMMALLEPPETTDDSELAEELMSKAALLQEKWQVQAGDMYQIGAHRLLCGRCESDDNWQHLLGDGLADVAWWDPPYNVAYDAARKRKKDDPAAPSRKILNDDLPREEYLELLRQWLQAGVARLKPGGVVYIAHAESFGLETRQVASEAGIFVSQCLVWVKQAFTLGRQDHQWQHEPILYGWKPGAAHYWQGGYSQATVIDEAADLKKLSKGELLSLVNHLRNALDSTVIREPRSVACDLHPTMKPVRLVARQLWNSSRKEETVIELFSGSGTTMAAAQQIGRRCVATELDPKYCAVTLERLTAFGVRAEKVHGLS
jgi:DNA modification methylase